ncbi:hypothetical protein RI054_32g125740 [Pseudoscourfieldia marina]
MSARARGVAASGASGGAQPSPPLSPSSRGSGELASGAGGAGAGAGDSPWYTRPAFLTALASLAGVVLTALLVIGNSADARALGHVARIATGRTARRGGGLNADVDDDDYRKLHKLGRRGGGTTAGDDEANALEDPDDLSSQSSLNVNTGRADEGATIKFPGEDERRAGTIVDLDVRPFANLANLADVHNASEARSKELGYKGLGADGYRSAQRQPQRDPHVFGGHWARQAESLAAQRRDQKRLCETLSIDLAAIRKDFEDAMFEASESRKDLDEFLGDAHPPPPPVPIAPQVFSDEVNTNPSPPPVESPPPYLDKRERYDGPAQAIVAIQRAQMEHEHNMNLHGRLAERIRAIRELFNEGTRNMELMEKNEETLLQTQGECTQLVVGTSTRVLTLLRQVQAALFDTDALLEQASSDPRVGNADEEIRLIEDTKQMVPARAMATLQSAIKRIDERESMLEALNATVFRTRERVDALHGWCKSLHGHFESFKNAHNRVDEERKAVKTAKDDLPKLEKAVEEFEPKLFEIGKEAPYLNQLKELAESMQAHHNAAKRLARIENHDRKQGVSELRIRLDHDAMPEDEKLFREQLDTIALKLKPLQETRGRLLSIEEEVDTIDAYTMEPLKSSIAEAKTLVGDVGLKFDELCAVANTKNGMRQGDVRDVFVATEEYLLDHGGTPLFVRPKGIENFQLPTFTQQDRNAKRSKWELESNFTFNNRPPPSIPTPPEPPRDVEPTIIAADVSVPADELAPSPPPRYNPNFDPGTTTTIPPITDAETIGT